MARGARQTKAASIKDVAALAQVSVPTVSRYLNDRERVSDEKCEKIAKAIEMLGYRPNPIARALVKERTKSIAVLSTNTTLYGQSHCIEGIEESARAAGYSLAIEILSDTSRSKLRASVQSSLDQNPAGVILLNFDQVGNDAFVYLPSDLPTVLIAGGREKETAQISLCERESGYELTKYLLSLGHRTVYHVAIPGDGGDYTRLSGWRRACEEAGVPTTVPIEALWRGTDIRRTGIVMWRFQVSLLFVNPRGVCVNYNGD